MSNPMKITQDSLIFLVKNNKIKEGIQSVRN